MLFLSITPFKDRVRSWRLRREMFYDQELSFYVIAWIDLLGQGDLLEQWLPQKVTDPTFKQEAAKTIGNVTRFRAITRQAARDLSHIQLSPAQIANIPPEKRRLVRSYLRPKIATSYLCDSGILAISLRGSDRDPPFIGIAIASLFHQLVIAFLTMLYSRTPIRGAISIGLCTELTRGELYGRGTSRAYRLESEAKYPRIVVDPEFIDFLKAWQTAEVPPAQRAINSSFLNDIVQCFEKDPVDNRLILSYLADKFGEPFKDVQMKMEVCRFIEEEIQAGRNIEKYQYLKSYFKRKNHWV